MNAFVFLKKTVRFVREMFYPRLLINYFYCLVCTDELWLVVSRELSSPPPQQTTSTSNELRFNQGTFNSQINRPIGQKQTAQRTDHVRPCSMFLLNWISAHNTFNWNHASESFRNSGNVKLMILIAQRIAVAQSLINAPTNNLRLSLQMRTVIQVSSLWSSSNVSG